MSDNSDPSVANSAANSAKNSHTLATQHLIEVADLSFSYLFGEADDPAATHGEASLIDISFTAPAGSLTLLTGASGSGKSSALRVLNGLIPHFHPGKLQGTAHIAGHSVPESEIWQAGLNTATVFQNPRTQFFTTAVDDELAFAGQNYAVPPAELASRISTATAQVGIAPLRGRALTALSGGELQQVATACALAQNAKVLLFDEPTANLSPAAVTKFAQLVAELKTAGHTIVIAEHRLFFLRELADQVLLFSQGKIAKRYTGKQFFELSRDERIALGLRTLHTPPAPPAPPAHTAQVAQAAAIPHKDSGVTIQDLQFSYGRQLTLDIPELHFPAGQVTVLTGVNGAGKTTLARIMCGLEKVRRGSISVAGKACSAQKLNQLSYVVMQDVHRQLFADSALAEVTLGLSREQAKSVDASALLSEFDLAEFSDRHPMSLSGGQKQRLVIASAVACDKQLYIFDEPTSGVDWRHLTAIAARLKQLAQSGAVVVVITHDLELLDLCADRIVTLRKLAATHPPAARSSQQAHTQDEPASPQAITTVITRTDEHSKHS